MNREEAKACIEQIGIFPGIRVNSSESAFYCAETLYEAGIPVAEITMTVPGVEVIRKFAKQFPNLVVGAGTVLDSETAKRCLDAGARFITSTRFVLKVVVMPLELSVVVISVP